MLTNFASELSAQRQLATAGLADAQQCGDTVLASAMRQRLVDLDRIAAINEDALAS